VNRDVRWTVVSSVVLGVVLLLSLAVLAFAGSEAAWRVLGLSLGVCAGTGVGYLVGRLVRVDSSRPRSLVGAWVTYTALVATAIPVVLLLSGSPSNTSVYDGAAFGAFLGLISLFWYAALPTAPEAPEGEGGLSRGFLRFGLQASGVVVGLVFGLVFTVYVVGPLSQRMA
jgi:hypothetical protein